MKSMTGYGRVTISDLTIELHSVNGKGISVKASAEYLPFDLDIRRKIQEKVSRGYVTVRISKEKVAPAILRELKSQWEEVAHALGYEKNDVTLQFLVDQLKTAPLKETPVREELLEGLEQAMVPFLEMKRAEGEALNADLTNYLEHLTTSCNKVEQFHQAPAAYRERLKKKLSELGIEDEERVAREVVFFAERIDISEEVTRMKSHIERCNTYLQSDGAVGRNIEFVLQEMLREVNTMGSKSHELGITNEVLDMKATLGKMKEQVANIE